MWNHPIPAPRDQRQCIASRLLCYLSSAQVIMASIIPVQWRRSTHKDTCMQQHYSLGRYVLMRRAGSNGGSRISVLLLLFILRHLILLDIILILYRIRRYYTYRLTVHVLASYGAFLTHVSLDYESTLRHKNIPARIISTWIIYLFLWDCLPWNVSYIKKGSKISLNIDLRNTLLSSSCRLSSWIFLCRLPCVLIQINI